MNLKPQDVLVLLKLVVVGQAPWSFNKLAVELGMSPSEVHAAVKRALAARLAIQAGDTVRPNLPNLEEFLLHGIQYVFVPERGGFSRGMPTAYAAAPMDSGFVADQTPPPVWPDPQGRERGESFSPIYKSAPRAAQHDPRLYELLALVDAIRGGRARERDMAAKELKKRLGSCAEETHSRLQGAHGDELLISGTIVVSRAAMQAVVRRFHIKRLVLFGSAARGELTPASDIDLLVEFEQGKEPSLGGMVDVQHAFVDLFGGRKVDVVTPSILNNPYRKRAIEKDMKELYAA